ncbi:MAG: hypothetical protein QM820_36960 [Minicystis sp.]
MHRVLFSCLALAASVTLPACGGGQLPDKSGSVNVLDIIADLQNPVGSASHAVTAGFSDTSATGGRTSCEVSEEGDCSLQICPRSSGGVPDGALRTAGAIRVASATKQVTLKPGADRRYATVSDPGAFWAGEDMITIEADGGDLPAFSAQVRAPRAVDVSAPDFAGGSTIQIARSQDLPVRWDGSFDGKVLAMLAYDVEATDEVVSLSCVWDPAAGQGVMPASLLGRMPSEVNGFASVDVLHDETVDAGGFHVIVGAQTSATAGTRSAIAPFLLVE